MGGYLAVVSAHELVCFPPSPHTPWCRDSLLELCPDGDLWFFLCLLASRDHSRLESVIHPFQRGFWEECLSREHNLVSFHRVHIWSMVDRPPCSALSGKAASSSCSPPSFWSVIKEGLLQSQPPIFRILWQESETTSKVVQTLCIIWEALLI